MVSRSRESFSRRNTSSGTLYLSSSSYGESGAHITRGVDRWADANASAFDRVMSRHDKRTRAHHEASLRGSPGTEIVTEHNPAGSPDTLIVVTEFGRSGRGFTWAAFASEI